MFVSSRLGIDDDALFFVLWSDVYLSDGSTRAIWLGDYEQGTWAVSDDGYFPLNASQTYSLAQGAIEGFPGITVIDNKGTLDSTALKSLIAAERETKAVDVAGYAEWPWEEQFAADHLEEEVPSIPEEATS